MLFLRFFLLILWTILTVIPWFFVILFRFKDPSLFKDYLQIYSPVACKVLGIRIHIEGVPLAEIEKIQPCIFVGNHQSGIDVISYAYLKFHRTVTVGKREILYVPFLGWIYWATGNILINRSKSRDAIARLTQVAKQIREKNLSIMIFPEGTRNKKLGEMLPFKKGAFHIAVTAQVPLIPVACSSLKHLFDERGRLIGGDIVLRKLEPIPTQGLTSADVERLSAEIRAKLEVAIREVTEKAKAMSRVVMLAVATTLTVSGMGCSGTPKNTFTMTEFWSSPIRVRRPVYEPSDPQVGPGGIDYQSSPLPNTKYDCEEPRSLLKKLDYSVVMACLRKMQTEGSVDEAHKAKYVLELGPQPVLKLDEDPEKPSCLRSALPELPVPREIFFQALKEDKLTCFSSRLEIEKGETLGIRLSSKGSVLKLEFPLEAFPKNFSDLERLLIAWSLTPLFNPDPEPNVEARVVPEALCNRCYDRKDATMRPKKDPPSWPNDVKPAEAKPAQP